MADDMVSGINANGQRATGMLGNAVEQFDYNADSQNNDFSDNGFYGADGKLAPGSVPLADRLAAEAQAKADATWAGPGTLEEVSGYGEGRALAQNTQRDANLAGDFYGRQALMQDKYGKGGGYSLGQQRLDSALAGAAGGDKIDAAKSQWSGLLGKFDAASAGAKGRVANVQANNKAAAQSYKDAAAKLHAEAKAQRESALKPVEEEQKRERGFDEAERQRVGGYPSGKKTGGGLDSWQGTRDREDFGRDRRSGGYVRDYF